MKPNLAMQPNVFDAPYVRTRIAAAGSLAALKFTKKLQGAETARNNLIRANALDRADAQISKKTKRDNLAVTARVPTPKRKRGK